MSDDQQNPPAQPEFGELAPEGWSWNPEANAPHTPETLKAAEVAAKAAAKAKAAATAARTKAEERASTSGSLFSSGPKPTKPSAADETDTAPKSEKPAPMAKPSRAPKAAKGAAAVFVAPPAADSDSNTADRAVARAKLTSDRFITWGLLGVAVFSVVTGLGDYVNLTRTLNAAFEQLNEMEPGLNLEPYSNLGLANVLGLGIVFTQAIIMGLTFWWAIRRMRVGKMAFWVPVLGFAASSVAVLGFMILAFVADPTAWDAVVTYIQSNPTATTPGQSS